MSDNEGRTPRVWVPAGQRESAPRIGRAKVLPGLASGVVMLVRGSTALMVAQLSSGDAGMPGSDPPALAPAPQVRMDALLPPPTAPPAVATPRQPVAAPAEETPRQPAAQPTVEAPRLPATAPAPKPELASVATDAQRRRPVRPTELASAAPEQKRAPEQSARKVAPAPPDWTRMQAGSQQWMEPQFGRSVCARYGISQGHCDRSIDR